MKRATGIQRSTRIKRSTTMRHSLDCVNQFSFETWLHNKFGHAPPIARKNHATTFKGGDPTNG